MSAILFAAHWILGHVVSKSMECRSKKRTNVWNELSALNRE